MVALKEKGNIISYERNKRKMSAAASNQESSSNNQESSNNNQQGNQANSQNESARDGLVRLTNFMKTASVFLGVLTVFASGIIYVVANIVGHGKDIEYLKGNMSDISNEVTEINQSIEQLKELTDDDHEIFLELASASKDEEVYNITFKDIYQVKTETVANESYLAQPSWENNCIVASDVNGDLTYTAEDLYNTLIRTSYMEGENEIYFYGRFNQNNHWNGKCILNVYNNDKLVSIFEGTYNDGDLFSYKRVEEGEDSTWIVNDRKRQGDYNSGETWIYEKTEDFSKGFTTENVQDKQILTVDRFLNSINKKLLGYYKGNTSNNLYNDDSGNAYSVRYDDAGNVRYLYKGKMKDGYGNDDGKDPKIKSWAFIWGDANDGFHYHEGKFSKGSPKNTTKDWKYPVDQAFIESIVNPDYFNCSLKGLID